LNGKCIINFLKIKNLSLGAQLIELKKMNGIVGHRKAFDVSLETSTHPKKNSSKCVTTLEFPQIHDF
jgi:hypothetical protein